MTSKVNKVNRYELLDKENGELIPAVMWVRSKWKGEPFVMTFQLAFKFLAKDKEITLEARRVLDFMMSELDFENYMFMPQSEVAKELDMQKQNVNRAIKLLVDKGIIIEGPKVNRSRCYRLNYNFGWKGTLKNLKTLQKEEQTK